MKKEHYLKSGAQGLIDDMKTPKQFLEFLTEALSWVHDYEIAQAVGKPTDSPHFRVIVLINELVFPWMDSNEENQIEKLSHGLYQVYDTYGFEGMRDTTCYILAAFGKELDTGVPNKECFAKYAAGIHALYEIQECLENFEHEINIERKEAA